MKFGGVSVATPEQISQIADIIISRIPHYQRIVVVVSAMGDTTNQLIALAKQVNPDLPQREYDMLVTAGERISVSLTAMSLLAKKQKAMSFTGSQSGIMTCDRHTNARIIDVRPRRLEACFNDNYIAVVAGFQGMSQEKGEITTLGRGGSDTTAVALGIALKADKVEFFKEFSGIYDKDPKKNAEALLISHLSYQEALKIIEGGAKVLHGRCIELAYKNNLPLHVLSFKDYNMQQSQGTMIFDPSLNKNKYPLYEEI
jgi:aspartate kinase